LLSTLNVCLWTLSTTQSLPAYQYYHTEHAASVTDPLDQTAIADPSGALPKQPCASHTIHYPMLRDRQGVVIQVLSQPHVQCQFHSEIQRQCQVHCQVHSQLATLFSHGVTVVTHLEVQPVCTHALSAHCTPSPPHTHLASSSTPEYTHASHSHATQSIRTSTGRRQHC